MCNRIPRLRIGPIGVHERGRMPFIIQCDRCLSNTDMSDITVTTGGSDVCSTCLRRAYWQCDYCSGWSRNGYDCGDNECRRYDSDDEPCGCSSYDDDDDDDGGYIRSYSYKPDPVFHGDGPLYLGAEIEIYTGYQTTELARLATTHLGGLGYLKDDSSIGGGFEMVTHPMSYSYAMESFPWGMLTELEAGGGAATDDTGIHVHVNRDGFSSPCHMYRWMKFVYRNQPDVIKVARRQSYNWAPFSSDARSRIKHYAKGDRGYDRYNAINVTNRATLELRIFASSLNPGEVKAALAFAAASVEYTRKLTAYDITNHNGWEWSAFASWVADQPEYQPLAAQLESLASCVF